MPSMANANVIVRVQARGGKFLAGDIGYSQVRIIDPQGNTTGPFVTQGANSGWFQAAWAPGIVTEPLPPGSTGSERYYLTSDAQSACLATTVAVGDEPALYTFEATALFKTANPVTATSAVWILPPDANNTPQEVLIVIPGLAVSVTDVSIGGGVLSVTATVTMMCGCPIIGRIPFNGNPNEMVISPWPPEDFEVTGELQTSIGPRPLAFTYQTKNTFTAAVPLPFFVTASSVNVTAVQPRMKNAGYTAYAIP